MLAMKRNKPMVCPNQITVLKCLADGNRIAERNKPAQIKPLKPKPIACINNLITGRGIQLQDPKKRATISLQSSLTDKSRGSSAVHTCTHTSSRTNTTKSLNASSVSYGQYMKANKRIRHAENDVLNRCKLSNICSPECDKYGAFKNIYVTKKFADAQASVPITATTARKRKSQYTTTQTTPTSSVLYSSPTKYSSYQSSQFDSSSQSAKISNKRTPSRYSDRPKIPMWACQSSARMIASKHILKPPKKMNKKRKATLKKRRENKKCFVSPSISSFASTVSFRYLSKDITTTDVFFKQFKKKLLEEKMKNRPPKAVRQHKLRPLIYHVAGPPVYTWNYEEIMRKMK